MEAEDERQVQNYDFNVDLITKLLSCMSLRLNSANNEKIGKWRVSNIPILLCYFLTLIVLAVFGESFHIKDSLKKNDLFMAIEVTSQLFPTTIDLAKGCQLLMAAADLKTVLNDLTKSWYTYTVNNVLRDNILSKTNKMITFCKFYVYSTVVAASCFGVPGLVNLGKEFFHRKNVTYAHNYELRFFILKYPFELNTFERYLPVMACEVCLVIGAVLFWLAGDVIFVFLTTHVSCQLDILQNDMKSLIDSDVDGYSLKQSFNNIVRRHLEILKICSEIEYMFSPLVFVIVLLSSINICFNMVAANYAASNGDYAVAAKYFSLFVITFFQVMFYCVCAEELTERTRAFASTVYSANWVKKSNVLGIYIQMLLLKSQKPFYCTGCGFFPIGHTRLTAILNAAYTYYMMLQASTK